MPELKKWDYPLEVIYEDDDFAIINKPFGVISHPTSNNKDQTLVNILLNKNSIVELIQSDLNSQNIVKNLNNILDSNFRINMHKDYEDLRKKLQTGETVSLEIAKEILDARIA